MNFIASAWKQASQPKTTSWSRTSATQILSALSGVAYGRGTLISHFLVVPNLYPAIGCINELSGASKPMILELYSDNS
jgi:hypothetical protein